MSIMSVLVVIFRESDAMSLTRWGWRFAQASKRDLVILSAEKGGKAARSTEVPKDDPKHPLRSEPALSKVFEALEELGLDVGQDSVGPSADSSAPEDSDPSVGSDPPGISDPPMPSDPPETPEAPARSEVEVRKLTHADLCRGVLKEIERSSARLLMLGGRSSGHGRPEGSGVGRRLFQKAPCTALLMRLGSTDGESCQRILVPAAGGQHSQEALRWAGRCCDAEGGSFVSLFVESDSGEEAQEVGERILHRTLSEAGLQDHPSLEERVELAASVSAGIAKVAEEGYDLVLMGASHSGALHQKLFKTVPERLIAKQGGVTLGVLRVAQPEMSWWRRSLTSLLDLSVPQLERADRVALVENLELQSRWSFDFMALIGLSTAIASLGLLQDSAAVVIGAMLVAPLMTPLLGAGLALVQGNLPLMRSAAQAIILGFLTALAIGAALGSLVPLPSLSSELAARGQPTLLDLGVAFLSGVAAAYCVGRPNLSAALPGVAIAAALVPPIATIGISLALGDIDNARGSAMLFGVNVVAVIVGAAVSFFGAGIRSNRSLRRGNRWARAMLAALALVLVALTVPLASFLVAQISPLPHSSVKVTSELRQEFEKRLSQESQVQLLEMEKELQEGKNLFILRVSASSPVDEVLASDLAAIAAQQSGMAVEVRVHTELLNTSRASAELPRPNAPQ